MPEISWQLSDWLDWLDANGRKNIAFSPEDNLSLLKKFAVSADLLPVEIPVITVGGTNGKGSCVAFCESILKAVGYRVGAYTSPHLFKFNERIRIAGREAQDAEICKAFWAIFQHAQQQNILLSYFEFATLAALKIFKNNLLDVLILEVGVGGRLDAVNIADSDVAVITSISRDHTAWLGETREAIGYEKAAIFRAGRPAVYGECRECLPASVKKYAEKIGARLCFVDNRDEENSAAAIAVTALNQLKIFASLSDKKKAAAIRLGLKAVYLPGRLEIVEKPVWQVFDVAHNPASGARLAEFILSQAPKACKIDAVVGMLKDKLMAETLMPFIELIDEWYIASLSGARGAAAFEIAVILQEFGVAEEKIYQFGSPEEAYREAINNALVDSEGSRLAIFGSFRTVSEIRRK